MNANTFVHFEDRKIEKRFDKLNSQKIKKHQQFCRYNRTEPQRCK